ncbi:MAG: CsiV family protein, partial [Gammaproteobacteria bacterium]
MSRSQTAIHYSQLKPNQPEPSQSEPSHQPEINKHRISMVCWLRQRWWVSSRIATVLSSLCLSLFGTIGHTQPDETFTTIEAQSIPQAPSTQTQTQTKTPESWYQIELYIFRQPAVSTTELWPPKENISFFSETAFMTIDPVPMANALIAYQQLPTDWLQTPNLRSALHNSRLYRILYEAAWRQPILADQEAKTIYLSGGKQQANYSELEGTLRLHKSRYLHLDAHLLLGRYEEKLMPIEMGNSEHIGSADHTPRVSHNLTANDTMPIDATNTQSLDSATNIALTDPLSSSDGNTAMEYRVVPIEIFELKQSRRMRSGELHYLDHPKM